MPIAIFGSVCVIVSFLTFIYFKEYAREEKLIAASQRKAEQDLLASLIAPQPKKKTSKITTDKKKDFN